ncbi:MAG: YceI family protein [Proteobacteria bacterium]|nr:YceI family protein [Pseudomonadota bacterium]
MHLFFKPTATVIGLLLVLTACQKQTIKTKKSQVWQLNTELSSLSFVTTKNKIFTEEHSLKFQQGVIDGKLAFMASVDLNSVATLIPIRDQRLRDILFETEQFPIASISTLIPQNLNLSVNQNVVLPFVLDLHGTKKSFAAEVVIQMVNNQLVVVNFEPILVNAKDFAMDAAINKLTKIAGLQSIDYAVLVDFKLTFEIN